MTLERKAVLKDLKIEKNGISIEEIPFINKLNLRGNSKDKDFLSKTGTILETFIPLDPNTKVSNTKFQVIWLSPNEWIINFFNNDIFIKIHNQLNDQLNPEKTSVTDISENKTVIRVVGNKSVELLRLEEQEKKIKIDKKNILIFIFFIFITLLCINFTNIKTSK